MLCIDINCDMGESYGIYTFGYDEQAMPLVTSINIACGFHASDPSHMLETIKLAKKYGVAVGAHPSFPDLVGFGRRYIGATPAEIKADVIYQIGALWALCKSENIKLQHVKVHGALYNTAEKDLAVATAIAQAIKSVDENLYMICSTNSTMVKAAQNIGIKYVEEAFADRAYTRDGTLVPRKQEGAVIRDVNIVAERVLSMIKTKTVPSIDGSSVKISPQTISVHGDAPGSVEIIKVIRDVLHQQGITVKSFSK